MFQPLTLQPGGNKRKALDAGSLNVGNTFWTSHSMAPAPGSLQAVLRYSFDLSRGLSESMDSKSMAQTSGQPGLPRHLCSHENSDGEVIAHQSTVPKKLLPALKHTVTT